MPNANKSPPLLWHYTTFDGLHGIVTKSELFASSLAYLNDTEEFAYTIKPLLGLLDAEGVTLSDIARGLAFNNDVPSLVKSVFKQTRGERLYVTCFSKERDDLSQWRSYTPRPPGFSIGFDREELRLLGIPLGFSLLDCTYPEPEQLAVEVRAALETATVGMKEEKQKLGMPAERQALEDFVDKWAFKVVEAMIGLAPTKKHPKFSAEKEVRLLGHLAGSMPRNLEIQYRLSGSLVVPYVRLPARPIEGPSPIKAILVGPCPHQNAVIEATRQMCWQHNIRPELHPSSVPYRNW
jgi:hypothetical protein